MRRYLLAVTNRVIRLFRSAIRTETSGESEKAGERGSPNSSGETDTPILTDEERVLAILEDHQGIVWQSHVVSTTSWSKSKVSRVLSKMEAAGSIRRHRVKRRKVVYLPGSEPDFLASHRGTEDA